MRRFGRSCLPLDSELDRLMLAQVILQAAKELPTEDPAKFTLDRCLEGIQELEAAILLPTLRGGASLRITIE
jgi:hypothetical protein